MDKITEIFFEQSRWEQVMCKAIAKDIRRADLMQIAKPEVRLKLYRAIKNGDYLISPPHTANIPKETPGEFRTVYVNEPVDRVLLSIANDLFFELMPERIHKSCKSYQKNISCGKIVKEAVKHIVKAKGEIIGFKSDLSKYFDSVPIEFIDKEFDRIEEKFGKSAIVDVIRKYYHQDIYFDENNEIQENFQSLKQGCSVASYLADVLLYDIDMKMSNLKGFYVRYSDDMLYIGEDYEEAMELLRTELDKIQIKLNPKKVEYLSKTSWFKFLGFAIKGDNISIYRTHIKNFQKEIEARTINQKNISLESAIKKVNNYLYYGDGEHSWADHVLPFVNVKKDIDELNKFVLDCLRAVATKKKKIGGLGYLTEGKDGVVSRGIGRNVKMNRIKTGDSIDGYLSIGMMQKARITSRALYHTLVNTM